MTRGDDVLAVLDGDPSRTHIERLPAEFDAVLGAAGVERRAIGGLAVARGPGAFTGLRIGLGAMQGLSLAWGVPVVGIATFDAVVVSVAAAIAGTGAHAFAVWLDAQRGEVCEARYIADPTAWPFWRPDGPPRVGVPEHLVGSGVFTGHAALMYRDQIDAAGGAVIAAPSALAPAVAAAGWRVIERGEHGGPADLQPLYVRRPDVEIERQRRHSA